MKRIAWRRLTCLLMLLLGGTCWASAASGGRDETDFDRRVKQYLDEHHSRWRDLNIPFEDGQVLHDLIEAKGYRSALEIGTSTGHSALWIAWALSKTGGKLITIEIDERRHRRALEHFEQAGLSDFIDARLADAHDLVRVLEGPFDFVFLDADKDWYVNYLEILAPKVTEGGCFTAHNALNTWMQGMPEFLERLESRTDFETTIDQTSRAGISISYKMASGE